MNAHKEAVRAPTQSALELDAAAELQRRKSSARTLAMLDVMRGAGSFWDANDDPIMQAVRAAMAAQTYAPAARFDLIYAAVLHEADKYAEACAREQR